MPAIVRRSSRFFKPDEPLENPLPATAKKVKKLDEAETASKAKTVVKAAKRDAAGDDAAETAIKPKKVAKAASKAAAGEATAVASHAPRTREEAAWAKGVPLVLGCDEAGRGPLAGPVVAASCALPADMPPIPGIGDSKTITDEATREELYERIVATPGVLWSARVVSAARIDEVNILMASLEAMRLSAVDVLATAAPSHALLLVDGPFSPWKEGDKYVAFQEPKPPPTTQLEVEPIKGGDAKVYCIAAASILAKVTRDRIMHAYDAEWPQYGLKGHKGYPTAAHVAAISKHGAAAIHRRTFAPLKARELPPPSESELQRVADIAAEAAGGCRA